MTTEPRYRLTVAAVLREGFAHRHDAIGAAVRIALRERVVVEIEDTEAQPTQPCRWLIDEGGVCRVSGRRA